MAPRSRIAWPPGLTCALGMLVVGFAGCVTPGGHPTDLEVSDPAIAALSPGDRGRAEALCPFGLPRHHPPASDPVRVVVHDAFAALESLPEKIPLWVCERVDAAQLSGELARPSDDAFQPDPELPLGARAELRDYLHSGYDRGHMAPAGDETVSPELKRETFLLSNMAPQAAGLNRQIWAKLEETVRRWAQERGQLQVVTGPLFLAGDGSLTPQKTIGPDAVAVPTHFYKLVVYRPPNGLPQALVFVLENRGYEKPWDFSTLQESIDWLQSKSGVDFLPDLPRTLAVPLETEVAPVWP